MRKQIYLFLGIVLLSGCFFAQGKGAIRGYVTDSKSGEKLAFCNALIVELDRGGSTDVNGYFIISGLPSNRTFTLRVSYIGYESRDFRVKVFDNKLTHLDIQLDPAGVTLMAVKKIARRVQRSNATDLGLQKISMQELELLPQSVETDIIRSLQTISGVQSKGDISAKYYVRGGESNQNLILLDGMTIFNPFHALGMFSVLDPEGVSSMEFYKGGYTAEYGQRLSSVLSVNSKYGDKNKYSLNTSVSFLSGKAMVEGPFLGGSFFISGRKSISKEVLKKFTNGEQIPLDFYDLTFKTHFDNFLGGKGTKLSLTGFFSNDKLVYDDPLKEDYDWGNSLFGMKILQITDSPLFLEFSLSHSKYKTNITAKETDSKDKRNEISDVSFSTKFTYVYPSKDEFCVGFDVKEVSSKLLLQSNFGATTDYDNSGTFIDAYIKYKFLRFENIGIDIGTRVNIATLNKRPGGQSIFEPRVNLTVRPWSFFKLKAAFGVYHQELTTFDNEKEVLSIFEPWVIIPKYLPLSESKHYIIGGELYWDNLVIKAEGYYKDLKNIASANYNKISNLDPDFIISSGKAYGGEAQIEYFLDNFRTTLSYTRSFAYKTLDQTGWKYYPKQDIRNSIKFTATYGLTENLSVGINWVYNSGMPYTKILSYYDKLDLNDYFLAERVYNEFHSYSILDDLNNGRLPDYHRLDINVTHKFDLDLIKAEVSLNLMNVYDRDNIFYFKRETGERVNMLPFLPTLKVKLRL